MQFETLLFLQLEKSIIPFKIPPKRIWVTMGSGVILQVLTRLFPQSHFIAVHVGKIISSEIREKYGQRVEFIWADSTDLQQNINLSPPYPSVTNYDAKLWPFVDKLAQDGDYIWNVAGDIPISNLI